MEYTGYNGRIEASDTQLTITHSGMTAKLGGLTRDAPRGIPLAAISGVRLKEASRVVNGSITLGIGGAEAANLNAGQAPSDPQTVIFRHKDNEQFRQLHDWLLQVIAHNRQHGVDTPTVPVEAAGRTVGERLTERAESAGQRVADLTAQRTATKEERLTTKLGGDRPDIVAAAARMGWRMGGNRELKKLAEHLHEGETVKYIAQGTYENDQGILALTDARLLFLFHGVMRQAKEDFPLRLISSVKTKSGLATGEIQVFVSGNTATISQIVKGDLNPLADAIRAGMSVQHASPAQAAPVAAAATVVPDAADQLRKLADLHASGILTDEEFAAKKAELLRRM